ncbi:hypothetical protein ACU4GA_17750 [Methylobacterium oryzae CBMB20]
MPLTSNVPGAGGSRNPALNPYLIAASNQLTRPTARPIALRPRHPAGSDHQRSVRRRPLLGDPQRRPLLRRPAGSDFAALRPPY